MPSSALLPRRRHQRKRTDPHGLQALPEERIIGVETGGCPHTAIREDASINLAVIAEMRLKRRIGLDDIVGFIEENGGLRAA